jgi:ATP-dependent protease HslVU (ClpYQ) peptidase subunit
MFLGRIQKKRLHEKLFADWQIKIKKQSPTLKKKSVNLLAEWATEAQITNLENYENTRT